MKSILHKMGSSAALLLITLAALAQQDSSYPEKQKKFDPNRLVFGGIVGASFGDFTFVQVSPQVGYMFNPYLTATVMQVSTYMAGCSPSALLC
ncbi:MAG: hypothetical protein MUF29_09505 [Chitinophagaceae bacterium]|nr:hypothetical protein [Chitinophagaceae bacterium]